MRIGILTGGGDVPGLNACIKSVVNRVSDAGHEVIGIRRGWGGLLATDPDDEKTIDPGFAQSTGVEARSSTRRAPTPATFGPRRFPTSSPGRRTVRAHSTSPST
jgi:6-phosphofructokinase